MSVPRKTVLGLFSRFAGRLRFPQLFVVVALLFLVDLLVPDLIPFADEVLLGLATLLLGNWKDGRETRRETDQVIEVEPEREP